MGYTSGNVVLGKCFHAPCYCLTASALDGTPGLGGRGIGEPCLVDDDCRQDRRLACNLDLNKCDCRDGFVLNTHILVCGMPFQIFIICNKWLEWSDS